MVYTYSMRAPAIALFALLAACGAARGSFTWSNSSTNRITYESGGTNFLVGSSNDATVACFVQLVYAGTNNTNDVAFDAGAGVSADDQVVSNLWIGARVAGENGRVNGGTFQVGDKIGFYYVRLWTAPTTNFSVGTIPSSPTNFYGDSALFFNSCTGGLCIPDTFNFGGTGFATTLRAQFTDTDGDGMPDWWELLHFGDPTNTAAVADAEPDGQNNLNEYRSGTDPTNAASVFEIVSAVATGGNAIVQWSSVTGKVYGVARSTNLFEGFAGIASNIAAIPPLNTITDAVGNTPYFYRIDVLY
jgi:hypothetical protein